VSDPDSPAGGPPKSGRVDAVDCARGFALIGMVLYHLSWDLANFRLIPPMFPFLPSMRLFSHAVASAFLALVGVSLVLAHRDRLNLPAFWRRLGIVALAAALVTAATSVLFPGEGVWFGILHCIVVASLAALPFVQAPAWASLLAGVVAVALPLAFHSSLFNATPLLWLGLGERLPNTLDWYPLLPWAGAVLLGLGFASLPGVIERMKAQSRWRARFRLARGVCFAGRHSLAIYLLHQLALLPLVWAAAASGLLATLPPPKPDFTAFLASCRQACEARGHSSSDCATSCQCVADAYDRAGAAGALGEGALDAPRKAELRRTVDACIAPAHQQ
jgi:uncharacterized membrane protein